MIILAGEVEQAQPHLRVAVRKTVTNIDIFLEEIVPRQRSSVPGIALTIPVGLDSGKDPRGMVEKDISAGVVQISAQCLARGRERKDRYLGQRIFKIGLGVLITCAN